MPKTYPNSRKEQWLLEFSQGRTIKQIAVKSNCDMRTVKRAIEEMQSRHAAQETMAQLYRDALRGHFERLNSALDMIINDLRLPDTYFTELAWVELASRPETLQSGVDLRETGREETGQAEDPFLDGALLSEHLKNGKAWKALIDWRRTQKRHRAACGMLQIRCLELLKMKTGLRAREERKAAKPFFHGEITGDLLCRTVVRHLSQGIDIGKITEQIVADDQGGVVRYQVTPLVESGADATKLSQCRDGIVQAFDELKNSPEAAQVLSTFRQLDKILPKARNELKAIRLLGVVPGHCRLCHQFGL